MNLPALLRTLDHAGIRLARVGDQLRLRGRVCDLDPAAVAAASVHKPALLKMLSEEETAPRQLLPAVTETAIQEYQLVTRAADLPAVLEALCASARVAIDTETTGLNPRTDRIRLMQLATDQGVFILDCFRVDPAPLWPALAATELILHNASFDLAFLWRLGFRPGRVCDLMLMSRLLTAGTREGNSLADLATRELGISLDKTQQTADWAGELSAEQLNYAALDARVTYDLYTPVMAKIQDAGLAKVAALENRAVPAFLWLACSGVQFDSPAWEKLAAESETSAAALTEKLNREAPPREDGKPWNWRSPQQVKAVFSMLGITLESTGDAILARVRHPLAALLRQHRKAAQLVKSFGRKWLDCADAGRIYPGWNQLGAASGRSACKQPNLQQVPKDQRYRCCFKAPAGHVIIKADYGQLQLRLAAKIAGEGRMLQAFKEGADLHTLTAQSITGKAEVTKQDRQLAKVLNFGLLFGMGARALRDYARQEYGVELTEAEARAHRARFFQTYPGLQKWHEQAARDQFRAKLVLQR